MVVTVVVNVNDVNVLEMVVRKDVDVVVLTVVGRELTTTTVFVKVVDVCTTTNVAWLATRTVVVVDVTSVVDVVVCRSVVGTIVVEE